MKARNIHQTSYDIVIIGAGIAGSTLALMLAKHTSYSIAVLDQQTLQFDLPEQGYAARISALSFSNQQLFNACGIWSALPKDRLCEYSKMHVWDNAQGDIVFDAGDSGLSHLGVMVENALLNYALIENLREYDHVTLLPSIDLEQLLFESDGQAKTVFNRGNTDLSESITAKLVVGCDGANSWVRNQMNIECEIWDYQQKAIVANVTCEKPHHNVARQKFLSTGPLAFLPLHHAHQNSIVWTLPNDLIDDIMALDEESFLKKLTTSFDGSLGEVYETSQRFAFPLKMRQAECYVKNNVVLVADAAHTVHPMAGQGLNIGLQDVACLAQQLIKAHKQKKLVNHRLTLRRYERQRRTEVWDMILGLETIKRCFEVQNPLFKAWLRRALKLLNKSELCKQQFVEIASAKQSL
ncbi:MAG: UbiH/UbiF/VisC/COQ6 family ubiquinone biosynthesis hydroxylase [Gammaproteobacteria bacterium]